MALDVGELVYRLTVDDSRFIQSNQQAQQTASQTATRINQSMAGASAGINTLATNTQAAARQLAQLELNRDLDRHAQAAANRLAELRTNAQQAGQSAEQIAINQSMIRDAVQATNEIEAMRRNAEQAATSVNEIELRAQLEAQLRDARQELERVQGSADDTSESVSRIGRAAEGAVSGMARVSGALSSSAGNTTAGSFLAGFSDKLGDLAGKTGPIAGSLLGVAVIGVAAGAALAAAIEDGMQGELRRDIFQAQTKTTEAQAKKFAFAAGESFADAFGESAEANLSTLKLSLQNGIIDPGTSQRDAQNVVNNLETISQALDGEVTTSVQAVSALMSSGLATSAQEAADMIANAVGGSANKGEDLLEVITEYAAGWKNAGITAEAALALIEQSTDLGAWNADPAADAMREFGRRVTEEGDTIIETLNDIGLDGEAMYKVFAEGGDGAFDAFDEAFDKIRSIEDPTKRAAAVMGLLGDTAGDFSEVFEQWDPSKALADFGEFEGAAARLAGIMGGNSATSVQGAIRSIETVSQGMKEALAEAFGPYIADFADSISNNRAGVIQFFIDVGNTGFEAAKSVLGFVAGGLEGLASFAEGGTEMSASFIRSIANMIAGLDNFLGPLASLIPGLPSFDGIAEDMMEFANTAEAGGKRAGDSLRGLAQDIRGPVIDAVDSAQDRFNDFAGNMKLSAAFNDESAKVSKAIGEIGVDADGAALKLDGWTGSIDRNNAAQVAMENGIKAMAEGFKNQIKTGMEAGNTVEALTGQYQDNYVAMIDQLMATGMSNKAAVDYLATLGLTPEFAETTILQPGMPEAKYELDVLKDKIINTPDAKTIHTSALTEDAIADLEALGFKVEKLPDGTVNVIAATEAAEANMIEWTNRPRSAVVNLVPMYRGQPASPEQIAESANRGSRAGGGGGGTFQADGSIRTRADGMIDAAHIQQGSGQGITTRSPLGPVRYAEGETQWEAYIPGAPSKRPRSEKILAETARRFGFGLINFDDIPAMADGGVVEGLSALGAKQAPALQVTSSYRQGDSGYHGSGQAVDFSNGYGNTPEQLAWANYLADNYKSQLKELIYIDPAFQRCIKNGEFVPDSFYAGAGDHTNHVHAAMAEPPTAPSAAGPSAPDNRTEREKITDQVIAEGKRRGISDKGIKAAVMTALAETDMQNLDYGMDGDNAGIMQQRSQGWGTFEDRKDPTKAAGMFYDKLDDFDYNAMSEAQAAQKVQQSGTADGSNYAVKAGEADELIAASNARGNGQMTVGTTDSGAALATDGQRVYVTNWPGSSSSYTPDSAPSSAPAGGTSEAAAADPNLIWSGGFRVFEKGGMNLPSEAGLYSDGADLVRFAEKGTGGEGYIPLGMQNRPRSVAITKEVARRFGYELVPMENGGLTGFGGYVGEQAGIKVPTSANGRRAAMSSALAFGVGGAFALASGFDADGNFTGQFDTGANSSSQLEKGFGDFTKEALPVLEGILEAVKEKIPITAEVHVDQSTGMANIAIMKGRL